MQNINKYDLIPVSALVLNVVGALLIGLHVLIPGLIIAILGLAAGITTRVLEKKLGMTEIIAYWAFVLSIILTVLSLLGFAGYTLWDYIFAKQIG